MCDRWLNSFSNFVSDMGHRPDGFTLERIDVNGDYSPDNCKWIPRAQQNLNKRTTKHNWVYWLKLRNKWLVSVSGKHIAITKEFNEAIRIRDEYVQAN